MLCEQQHDVISKSLPVPTGLISGAMEPNSWKDPSLWQRVLREHRVVVSTPQVLLDAMHHGYINMGQSIGLIVFDEAHHAADKHPYNVIMRNFYFQIYPNGTPNVARPCILGLTASPSFGKDVDRALE
jgi:endoribonuclease Dicer